MELTLIYLIAQIITTIYYTILGISYLLKDRFKILIANFIAHIGQTISMILLNGYTGAAMAFIMAVRDIIFVLSHKKTNKTINFIIFLFSIITILLLTIFTYNGPMSLLSVGATLLSTYALWQKNIKTYKKIGLIGALLWLTYNIYIKSIMGIILESVLTIFTIIGNKKDN